MNNGVEISKCPGYHILRKNVMTAFVNQQGITPSLLFRRKGEDVSTLMKKTPAELKTLDIDEIVGEMLEFFPEMTLTLVSIMIPEDRRDKFTISAIVPRLAMIYSILLFTRNKELSRTQRVLSLCLFDRLCDKKVRFTMSLIGVDYDCLHLR
jgi:hypothetical protein